MKTMSVADRCKVAEILGLDEQYVYQVTTGRRVLSAERCADFEAATGGLIRRWDLRPSDWHRIWPELIDEPGAPAIEKADAEPKAA